MKKLFAGIITLLVTFMMVSSVFATDFAKSVTYKPAPELVVKPGGIIGYIRDEDKNIITEEHEDCLIITPISEAETSDRIPKDAADLLLKVYNDLITGETKLSDVPGLDELVKDALGDRMSADDLVIKDMFDITAICDDIKTHLPVDGNTLELTFDVGIEPGTFFQVMVYIDGEWRLVEDVVNNGDGTVTINFEDICPVAFLVPADAAKGDDGTPNTGDVNTSQLVMWSVVAGVSLIAMISALLVYRRKMSR